MRVLAILCVALTLAGCLETDPHRADPSPAPPLPALAFSTPVPATTCRFANCYEPTIAADPTGRLFVADGSTSDIGVSLDGGLTWTVAKPPPMPAGFTGSQSDVILQVAPSGRLYWSALVIWQPGGQGFVLEGIQIAWSDDGAKSWAGNVHLSPATTTVQVLAPDRQWLGFGPGETVYVTYNQIPTGIWFARSDNGGRTWTGWTRAAPLEGRGGGIGQSGPPVVDSKGRVYVPACDLREGATAVFSSSDRGATFRRATVPGGCSWFPILAVTPQDEVVLAVQPGSNVFMSHSTDEGRTFSTPKSWGSGATAAPWPVALGNGSIAVAWFKAKAGAADLVVSFGSIGGPVAKDFVVESTQGSASRTPALTDFASAALLPDGRLATVLTQGKDAMVSVTNLAVG